MTVARIHFEDRDTWRAWLEENHRRATAVWLVFFRKHTRVPTVSYDAAVEEALCFGWIDNLVRRLDDDRYLRRFTPRADPGRWSRINLERFERLRASGRMTPAGLAVLDPRAEPLDPPSRSVLSVPPYFRDGLASNQRARAFFQQLAPSYRRAFVGWVDSAKREETRRRRLAEALALLESGQKLGMK